MNLPPDPRTARATNRLVFFALMLCVGLFVGGFLVGRVIPTQAREALSAIAAFSVVALSFAVFTASRLTRRRERRLPKR